MKRSTSKLLMAALNARDAAETRMRDALSAIVGEHVAWNWRGHFQRGKVTGFARDIVHIRNDKSGRIVRIHADELVTE